MYVLQKTKSIIEFSINLNVLGNQDSKLLYNYFNIQFDDLLVELFYLN